MTNIRQARASIVLVGMLICFSNYGQIDAFTPPLTSTNKNIKRALVNTIPLRTKCKSSLHAFLRSKKGDTDKPDKSKDSDEKSAAQTKSKDSNEESAAEPISKDNNVEVAAKEQKKPTVTCSKLRTLKDRMWVREALEDLTAAEFACSLASFPDASNEDGKKKKSAVDFENILSKLEKRIEDMCVISGEDDKTCIAAFPLYKELDEESESSKKQCWSLKENFGMASLTYTDEQRRALVTRLLSSRASLLQAMTGKKNSKGDSSDLDQIREKLQTPDAIEDEKDKGNVKPDLYVREDGTIDWDGALQDRAALKKFGISVWARINGQDADDIDEDSVQDEVADSHGEDKKVTAKIPETKEIQEKKKTLEILEKELKRMEKENTVLLNSAVSAGSAVANVNLASLNPELRSKIRQSNDDIERKKEEVSFQKVNYEMERIFTYLDGELGNTSGKGYIPLQDRLNVAEFGLLESQLESMNGQIANGEAIDVDVLSVMLDQTVDFKRRLGIDYYVAGLTFDQEAIKIWAGDLIEQSKTGLGFYFKGVKLLWNDVVFSTSLLGRALYQGYTLKPREVRTLRRTFKDVLTFIPFVIILIIPLSPVGHVLVFGAIQRFFPDFFPSCFTERRQNLFTLYESTEYTDITIDENWQEKVSRILEAAGFWIVDNAKRLFGQARDETNGEPNDDLNGDKNGDPKDKSRSKK